MTSIVNVVKSHQVISYYLLAFAISWLCWMPILLFTSGVSVTTYPLLLVGTCSPALSAIILTYVQNGKSGVVILLKRLIQWREGIQWYVVALFLLPILMAIGILLNAALGGTIGHTQFMDIGLLLIPAMPLIVVFAVITGGPLEEELGWRGYVLPRLQSSFNPLYASVIIGVLWGLWHLPLFGIPGTSQNGLPVVFFILFNIANATLMTWVYNHTHGSLLISMLFHAGGNIGITILPLLPATAGGSMLPAEIYLTLTWVAAIVVVILDWKVFMSKHVVGSSPGSAATS